MPFFKSLTKVPIHSYHQAMKYMVASLFLVSSGLSFAEDAEVQKTEVPAVPLVKKIDQDNFKIGEVYLNKKTREITFAGELIEPEDVIEFLVTTEFGKVHETLFITKIRPMSLNVALKLLGYKESKELFRILDEDYRPTDVFYKETDETKAAARFDIFVSWEADGKAHSCHVNQLIRNEKSKKAAKVAPYVYGGSYLLDGRFKADLSGDIIGVYTNRGAIANLSNTGHEDDTIWFPNKEKLPKVGTKVTFSIKKSVAKK